MSLPRFAVRQVVLVNLIFALLMLAGVQIARRVPIDLFPDISFNSSLIVTTWRGASPQEVERLVTQQLEDEIDDVTGIKEILSYSSSGLSEINVEWDESLSDIDYEAALNDLRAAIDRVDDLPEDAETPILLELSVGESYPVALVTVADVGGVGEYTTREVARDIQDRLERFPGLRKAELRGAREREIHVHVDEHRAAQYDLTLAEIDRVIAQNNQNFAGGSFNDPSSREVRVRGLGQFDSAERLAATVVKKNPDGTHVLLSDVAEVKEGFEKRRLFGRHQGHPAINVGVSKESDQDILELVDRVRAFAAEYDATAPEGVEVSVTFDSSRYVAARIELMRNNLLLGIVFVIFVLWLTVGFRNAMLAIVGVPFSFLAAVILFPLLDITINALSLVGFIMVSGMLVDDAIIILENIYRHVEEGEPLEEAIVRGTEEVMWPVTAAIATTVAAFIPMLLVSGTSGEFMSILPKTVIVCLLGSLFEALFVLPAHYLDWGSRRKASDSLGEARTGLAAWSYRVRARVDAGLEKLRERYIRAQGAILRQRGAFLVMCVAAFWFSCGLSRHIPVELFPSDVNRLIVAVECATDFGIDQTDEVVRGLEDSLVPLASELTGVSSNVGITLTADEVPVRGVNVGMLFVSFPITRQNLEDPNRVLDLVRERVDAFAEANPHGIVSLRVQSPRNGPPIGKPVAIRIQSDDYAEAKQIAEEMKAELATIPGVFNIEDNLPLGPRELRVALDEHRASIHGLTFADVGFTLLAANDGSVSTTFKDPNSDEDVDIRVQLREEQRRSMSDLLDAEVRTPAGYRVKLSDVARITVERGYQSLYHYDGQRAVIVYADVDNEQATSVSANEAMRARFEDVPKRYPGVNLVFGGEFQDTDDAFADMRRAFLLAVLAIFGILAAQFRSYTQPLIVMSVIVFSFIGVSLGMWTMNALLGGYALSMYVLYALVGLAGIVVNDSLVLIDFVNKERERGTPAVEAVQVASRKRFRPILLTTVTTITGLAPMAIGLTGYSHVFGPFAAAIVFGLASASLLTLFVVPSLYLELEDLKAAVRRRFRRRDIAPVPEPARVARSG
ncbi:MAG: efflux RND transporter permease subunit [Myxococcota bacterium]|nr:efflux RND transporter permease subunit [Myxococcota bacterium]